MLSRAKPLLLVACLLSLFTGRNTDTLGATPKARTYGDPIKHGDLENEKIIESSGLAASRKFPGRFWTHNDSGNKPRLYAFNRKGQHLGTSKIKNAKCDDWEDLAIANINGVSTLIIGDIGNNTRRRDELSIYFADEPENPKKDIKVSRKIDLTWDGEPFDSEALAYDEQTQEFFLFEKKLGLGNRVFRFTFDPRKMKQTVKAQVIGTLNIPMITAADISSDGKRLAICTYLNGFLFTRKAGETWQKAFRGDAEIVTLPARRQGETICFGPNDSLFLTSEKRPTPFFEIRLSANNK